MLQAPIDTPPATASADAPTIKLDLLGLMTHAAWPVKLTIGLLVGCSLLVWIIAVLKLLQIARLKMAERDFDKRARQTSSLVELFEFARLHGAPGARVVGSLGTRGAGAQIDRLKAIADRSILDEAQGARALMWLLAFIAAGAPFIGLFGTVYGIMGRRSSASGRPRPRASPSWPQAIGEALITTAIGLAAAIPAVFFYNWIDKRIGDFVSEVEAGAAEWVAFVSEQAPREREEAGAAIASARRASGRPRA